MSQKIASKPNQAVLLGAWCARLALPAQIQRGRWPTRHLSAPALHHPVFLQPAFSSWHGCCESLLSTASHPPLTLSFSPSGCAEKINNWKWHRMTLFLYIYIFFCFVLLGCACIVFLLLFSVGVEDTLALRWLTNGFALCCWMCLILLFLTLWAVSVSPSPVQTAPRKTCHASWWFAHLTHIVWELGTRLSDSTRGSSVRGMFQVSVPFRIIDYCAISRCVP